MLFKIDLISHPHAIQVHMSLTVFFSLPAIHSLEPLYE